MSFGGFTPANRADKGVKSNVDGLLVSRDDKLETATQSEVRVSAGLDPDAEYVDTDKLEETKGELEEYLQSALAPIEADIEALGTYKSNVGHTHAIGDVDNLQTTLDGKSSTSHTHNAATTSVNGFMASTDKAKLDGIATGANNYTHPSQTAIDVNATDNGINVIDRIQVNNAGHVTAVSTRNLSDATTSSAGVMSAADKTKLDGIATGANNYTHPTQTAIDVNATDNGVNVIDRVVVNNNGHVTSVTTRDLSVASTSGAGAMSAVDKVFLDALRALNSFTITSQPAAYTVVTSADSTTLSISTSASSLSLSYQWQTLAGAVWVDVVGANASSYTLPTYTSLFGRSSFRCVASSAAVTVISNIAAVEQLPLDQFSITGQAYSLLRLRKGHTGAVVRLRRSSDSEERDFTPVEIMDGTLLTWSGSGSAFIKIWYDQTTGGRDESQTIANQQPRLVNNGVLETNEHGFAVPRFNDPADVVGHFMEANPAYTTTTTNVNLFTVFSALSVGSAIPYIMSDPAGFVGFVSYFFPSPLRVRVGTRRTATTAPNGSTTLSTNRTYVRYDSADRSRIKCFLDRYTAAEIDAADENANFTAFTKVRIGSNIAASATGDLTLPCFILAIGDLSSSQQAIRNRLADMYSVT